MVKAVWTILAQVRHRAIDFKDFEGADKSKGRVCNLRF